MLLTIVGGERLPLGLRNKLVFMRLGRVRWAPHRRKLALSYPCIAPAQALTATVGQVRESGPARNSFPSILGERHKRESVTMLVAAARAVAATDAAL